MSSKESGSINSLLDVTMQRIKEMADGNAIIGAPITAADGTTVLPVSKITYGFAAGGSDVGSKAAKDMFGGGTGAGITVAPVAFLVLKANGDVRLLQVNPHSDGFDKAVEMLPDVLDKMNGFLKKKPEAKASAAKAEEKEEN